MRRRASIGLFVLCVLLGVSVTVYTGVGSGNSGWAAAKRPVVRTIHPGKVNFGTWDPAQHAAYAAAAKKGNWDLQVAEAVAYADADQLFNRWGSQNVDVVFSIDAGYEQSLLRAAKKYPKTSWVMMTSLSTTNGLKNVAGYSLDWCQIGYAQGMIAALATKSGTIGNVGAIQIIPAKLILEGEKYGVRATGKKVKVETRYTGDFLGAAKAQEITSALIGQGADVIIGVTNGAVASQIASRVQSEGAHYIGTYLNEKPFAPKATITSVLSDFSRDYSNVVKSRMAGTFKSQIIANRGFGDGVLRLTPFNTGYGKIEKKATALIANLTNGKFKFPKRSTCGAK